MPLEDNETLKQAFLAINVPYNKHGEAASRRAKELEVKEFQDFGATEVTTLPEGATALPFIWVIADKPRGNGTFKRKARLCVQGHKEPGVKQLETRAPTVSKQNVRLALAHLASDSEYKCLVSDVKRAFLQSAKLERNVYLKPPPEFGLKPN